MTDLMDQAVGKIKLLPEADQDAVASLILLELESEECWERLFADPRSADVLSAMADGALEDIREGRIEPLDVDTL